MLLRFGEDEVPRINATLIMSLLFGLNATAVFTLVSVIAKEDIIIGSRAHSLILAGLIIGLNFYIIFFKKRYVEIENNLSENWEKSKLKSILLLIAYVVITGVLLWYSLNYAREHSY